MADEESKPSLISIDAVIPVLVIGLVVFAIFGAFIAKGFHWYEGILNALYSWDWMTIRRNLAIFFTFVNAALVALAMYSLRRIVELRKAGLVEEKEIHPVLPRDEVRESWSHIRDLANSSNPSDWNMAVLRADALLDDVLRHMGYEGVSMADRLKIVDPARLKSIDRVWSGHRLRNMIAHDPTEQHTKETIIHALRSYEQAMKELDMME